jgi:hypothetical protein
MRVLTQAEVDELPHGSAVRVIWSGGNGPHYYTVVVDQHQQRYAVSQRDYEFMGENWRLVAHRLDNVGYHPLTEVSAV